MVRVCAAAGSLCAAAGEAWGAQVTKLAYEGLSTNSTGDGESLQYAETFSNANANGYSYLAVFITGNNPVVIAPGTSWVTLRPPPNSTNAKVLKGVNGDTGINLNPALPFKFAPAAGQNTFVINSAGNETVQLYFT
jgi:hypothetical protein